MEGFNQSNAALQLACTTTSSEENEVYSWDPAGQGTCTRAFDTVVKNTLSTGEVVGTPTSTPGTEVSTADICCTQGDLMSDSNLLIACITTPTEENEVYTWDPSGQGTCTRAFDAVVTNTLSTGEVVGTPTSTSSSETSTQDICCM